MRTLGISRPSTLRWTIRCHGTTAAIELRETSDAEHAGTAAADRVVAGKHVDLSSTDEAAWPRLIALSASELAERRLAAPLTHPPLQTRAQLPSVRLVSFAAKTKPRKRYEPAFGLSLSHLGSPRTWLIGPILGADLRLGRVGLVGTELRAQWGQSTHADANVMWQHVGVATTAGVAWNFGIVELGIVVGMRVGQLRLAGEAKEIDASGRRLVGPVGGPLVGTRLQVVPIGDLLLGVNWEVGYGLWPFEGTDEGRGTLVTVEGAFSSTALRIGWRF